MNKRLLQQLVSKRLSSYKIAEELNLSQTTIAYWLKKHGLKTQPYKIPSQDKSSPYALCGKCHKKKRRSEFYKRSDRKNGLMYYCKKCFNKNCADRWKDRKIQHMLLKGGKCERCNLSIEKSHYSVFEFHHRDPKTKRDDWRNLWSRNPKEIFKELDKCALVCANCHRLIHAEWSARRDLNS